MPTRRSRPDMNFGDYSVLQICVKIIEVKIYQWTIEIITVVATK
jgi:hypothetical protein